MEGEKPTERQIDFATAISETVGADLPEDFTKEAYSEFIDENIGEFKKIQGEIRYGSRKAFSLNHSYVLSDGYNGDTRLRKNPKT